MGQLKASTIIEVLVAMVIVAIAVGIGSIIIINVMQHHGNIQVYKAESIIQENMNKVIENSAVEAIEIYDEPQLKVIRKLTKLQETTRYVLAEYVASDENGKMLLKYKKLQRVE